MGTSCSGANSAPEILVVEDDSLVRETIVEHLRDCGYLVVEAASAEEAQALLQDGVRVTFVFSDVVMPGQNGFELARWIHSRFPEVQILLTSGYQSAARGRTTDRLLPKPYLLAQVVQAIETTIHST